MKGPPLPEPIKGDYAQTNTTQRILDAIEGKILSLKRLGRFNLF